MPGCKGCGVDIPDSQAKRYDGYCSECHSRIWQEMLLGVHTGGRQISKMPLLWFLLEDRKRRAKKKKN